MLTMILSFFLGIGLAASAGFRVFLPLLVMSVAAHFGIIPLDENWAWAGSFAAMATLSVASIIEIGAYYIPFLDNILDTIAVPMAGIAGTLLMATAMTDVTPILKWSLAIIAGGGAASTISATSATTRMASSVATAGIANPIVSTVETVTAFFLSVVSVLIPFLGFIMVLMIAYFIYKAYKTFKGKTLQEVEPVAKLPRIGKL